MDLQNIRVEFTTEKLMTRFEDIVYEITYSSISTLPQLKIDFETAFGLTVETAVVQLTESEYGVGAEPRIWTGYGEEGFDLTNIATIATEQPALYAELQATRLLIEAEITNQLNPE